MQGYFEVMRKYASFGGRAGRTEYWVFALINFAVFVVLEIFSMILSAVTPKLGLVMLVIVLIYALLVLLPSIAVTVRRLHDTDRSGAWGWIVLVPFVGALILLVFMLMEGTPGQNRYGPSPNVLLGKFA